jgi:SAM-dependent methyltransferase
MPPFNHDLRRDWENRASSHLTDKRGVLYSGLPVNINQAIGDWHAALVKKHLVPGLQGEMFVLDLAAGYGRLSQIIRDASANVHLVGVDFSLVYSHLYARDFGNAICADLRRPPFRVGTFDRIIAVTGLMYLDSEECDYAVERIVELLKPGGIALFLDPGTEMIRLLRRLRPSLAKRGTGGVGFLAEEYRHLFERGNCSIVATGGNAFFTWSLPLLLLLRNWPRVVARLARWATDVDSHFLGGGRFALHRWIVVRRED